MSFGTIGITPLELRFNIVARIESSVDISKRNARELVMNLPEIEIDDALEDQTSGFRPMELATIEDPSDFELNIINRLLPFEFERRYLGKRGLVIQQALIFWILPDIIIICGEKKIVEKAAQRVEYEFSRALGELVLKPAEFEWYYFLGFFETIEKKKQWLASDNSTDTPSTEIANGVEMRSIHDVDAEWEKESPQAKKISAKKAGDSTEDISTNLSIIQGRPMKSVTLFVAMEGEGCYVKLGKGGRILVRKKRRKLQKTEEPKDEEAKRIVWGLDFATRLLKANEDWKKLPVDTMLPSKDIYRVIHSKVSDLTKFLKREQRKRLKELEELRKELKKQKKESISGKV